MSKEKNEVDLREIGRDFAVNMLQQAVSTAKTTDQLNGQLRILDCAAVHIIATNIFNQIKNMGADKMSLVMQMKEDINDEVEAMFQHEDEMKTVPINNAEQ